MILIQSFKAFHDPCDKFWASPNSFDSIECFRCWRDSCWSFKALLGKGLTEFVAEAPAAVAAAAAQLLVHVAKSHL